MNKETENQNPSSQFLKAIQEYKTMKAGPKLQKLKFSCHGIQGIYHQNIQSKIGTWFADQYKMEEAQGIFERLTDADRSMGSVVTDEFINVKRTKTWRNIR